MPLPLGFSQDACGVSWKCMTVHSVERTSRVKGELAKRAGFDGHVVTIGHALVELYRMGHKDLAKKGVPAYWQAAAAAAVLSLIVSALLRSIT